MIVNRPAIRRQLGLRDEHTADFDLIADAVDAYITRWVPVEELSAAYISLGAGMLAARLWRRRSSPSGVESLGELGPTYVARFDPDLEHLLGIGRHQKPTVG